MNIRLILYVKAAIPVNSLPPSLSYSFFFLTLKIRKVYIDMASQLFRSSLRAIARPSLAKSFVTPTVASRMPTAAFSVTRAFSAAAPRWSNGVGKFDSCKLLLYH